MYAEIEMNARPLARHHVELRLLRYVIAVAEELHFGRASKRLHLSTPALSKQIKDLESNLGYALFERKTREVVVTSAGAAFTTEARQALAHADRAMELGYAASRGDSGVLLMGYSPWVRPSQLIALQPAFAVKMPGMRLELHSAYSTTQIDLLLKGALQAGIIELPANEDGLEILRLSHDELVVALAENHPFAGRSDVDLQDLASEPVIWITRALHPMLYQWLLDACLRLDYEPRIVHEVNTFSETLDLVSAGAGIGLVKRSITESVREPGVVFRELSGSKLFIDTGLAYRADNRSEALQSLLKLFRGHLT
jgi:DNA-binding transcriptional LysR family regulator